jgi:hypothetical protein
MEKKQKRSTGLDWLRKCSEVMGVLLTTLLSVKAGVEIILLILGN